MKGFWEGAMDEAALVKIGAQVMALELVIKRMLLAEFSVGVDDPARAAASAAHARRIETHLVDGIEHAEHNASGAARASGVAEAMTAEMEATIRRCFALALATLDTAAARTT